MSDNYPNLHFTSGVNCQVLTRRDPQPFNEWQRVTRFSLDQPVHRCLTAQLDRVNELLECGHWRLVSLSHLQR